MMKDFFEGYLNEDCEVDQYINTEVDLSGPNSVILIIQDLYNEMKRDDDRSRIAFGGQLSYSGASYLADLMTRLSSLMKHPLICTSYGEDFESHTDVFWSDEDRANEYRRVHQIIRVNELIIDESKPDDIMNNHISEAVKLAKNTLSEMINTDIEKDQ